MEINLSDYVFQKVSEAGVDDVFLVSGGGTMYLCDSLARSNKIKSWCNYNEQASAIAAEGYARVREGLGVCLVTTGPGSTNAISGVAGAWVDSIPMLVISGQVRTQILADYSYQRQVGPQEINIIDMVKPVTKYAVTLHDPKDIRYEIEKCIHLALSGRPGPVWLNLPLNIQSASIDPDKLRGYTPEATASVEVAEADVDLVESLLRTAQRPVIIGGNGIVLANAREKFRALVEKLNAPVMLSISAMDLLPEDFHLFQGRFGPGGQRRANFALQNADLVLAIGTSLSISCIGFSDQFAPKAKKILVNIDRGDLEKKNITINIPILADATKFIEKLSQRFEDKGYSPSRRWVEACAKWKQDYPPMPAKEFLQKDVVDVYRLYDVLSEKLGANDIIVSGNSTDGCILAYQGHRVKEGQRAFTSVCYGSMGWDLPAIIGACVADRSRRGVLITGDGSFLFNIHELMFLGMTKINAKLVISNNGGYKSIRGTQDRFFEGRYLGVDEKSGVGNPDFRQLAAAFNVNYIRVDHDSELESAIDEAFSDDQPWLIEVMTSKSQQVFRASSYRKADGTLASRPMEDMDPLLPRDELDRIMTMFD
jgi:acetolactate synthase-1/2/3 large subunit